MIELYNSRGHHKPVVQLKQIGRVTGASAESSGPPAESSVEIGSMVLGLPGVLRSVEIGWPVGGGYGPMLFS